MVFSEECEEKRATKYEAYILTTSMSALQVQREAALVDMPAWSWCELWQCEAVRLRRLVLPRVLQPFQNYQGV
jgi:hypothetical protein